MKTAAAIREAFLAYFEAKGHTRVPSSSLVPGNDPTLLFTNAGMVQFKDCFLGREKRSYVRAVSSQRCVRAGGKHNDLENVGYTARHHTFFEMLGNFSFGDYFKREAIQFAWEFLTASDWLAIPVDRLWVTVYAEDDEAYAIWKDEIGVPAERIVRIGDNKGAKYASDNFWAMGDTGPCGPCTEIFYDHGPGVAGGPPGSPEEDGDRYIEIWNNVFMQFNRSEDGVMHPLPKPSVDTGMGLERISAVMQHVHSNYEIDLFRSLLAAAAEAVGCRDEGQPSLRVIADHIRSCAFLIADGVLPSNEGRGYVLRRIIRRAVRHGHKLGAQGVFFHKLVTALADTMGDAYPELKTQQAMIAKVLLGEEEQFAQTLDKGMNLLDSALSERVLVGRFLERELRSNLKALQVITSGYVVDGELHDDRGYVGFQIISDIASLPDKVKNIKAYSEAFNKSYDPLQGCFLVFDKNAFDPDFFEKSLKKLVSVEKPSLKAIPYDEEDLREFRFISGEVAFKLHDTYGFPIDLTQDVCRERGFVVRMADYEALLADQRKRSQDAGKFDVNYSALPSLDGKTEFTGYAELDGSATVLALFRDGQPVEALHPDERGVIVLDRTPFYAESGGQAGDSGVLGTDTVHFEVQDTTKSGDSFLHHGVLVQGTVRCGDRLNACVNADIRQATACNHSATHLLHAALREVLGAHVVQKGSLVTAARLRFDFAHFEPVQPEQLQAVERLVNREIRANTAVITELTDMDHARQKGAMALFGEKYGDSVRVLSMGQGFSVELCGGTHVQRTGDIGLLRIVSEAGVAAGVRRIEAVTAAGALAWLDDQEACLRRLEQAVRSGREQLAGKVEQLVTSQKALEKEVAALKAKLATAAGGDLAAQAQTVNGVRVLAAELPGADVTTLRTTLDRLRDQLKSAVVVLATAGDGKVSLIAGVTPDLVARFRAGDLIRDLAPLVGGKGGGRADTAQGGGSQPAGMAAVLAAVPDWVKAR